MSEFERLVLEHGRYWFELVGGADWRSDMVMGLNTVAIVFPVLAGILAIIAITSRDGSE